MNIWKKLKIKTCKLTSQGLILGIQFLKRIHLKVIEKFGTPLIDNPDNYESLIPNDKADTDNQYSKMLKVALETPKNNNIAITGTYGSGKSSFLRTFEKTNKEWNYLHISLATFEEIEIKDNDDSKNKISVSKDDTLNQLLEKSIMQQIFYKEKDKTIPFSRFKRINNIKKSSIIWHSMATGILFLYTLTILFPTNIKEFFNFNLKVLFSNSVAFSLFIFIVVGFYFYKIFQYFIKLQVSKFNIKSGEIEVNNKDKTSILNEHLDEILYFFEVTSYNVVVIEDLDRFGNTEIFIKLRELNTLINNSKDIDRRVVFVYAIKDDMFKDKDRTKFFDFIIPIIPYINSSSSFEKIKEKFQNEDINEEFLRNIALRIDDMRLLINIANEYKIYKYKIGSEKLNRERLLAMIIYKNFYPSDFAKLHINEGNVYDIFNQRAKFIKEELEKNKQFQIDKNKAISELESKIILEKQKSITEMRMVYILKIFETINNTSFFSNSITHTLSDITKICKDDIFWQIVNAKVFARANGYQTQLFSEVEKAINPDFTYEEREKLIIEHPNEQLEQLKEDLQSLVENAKEIKKYNISQIAQIEDSKIFEKIEKENLLKFLIRDGFIREDYYDYISYFFPGSLTLKNRDFVLSVKDDKPLEFEYLLTNIDEVIKNLQAKDFESKAILNFNLLDYILQKNIKGYKFDNFTSNLSDGSDVSKQFILSFLLITQEQNKFTNIIVKKFKNLWFYIFKESHLTFEKQKEYFQIFLEGLDETTLASLNVDNSIKIFIEENSYLPKYGASNDTFEYLILELQIKYKKLNMDESKNVALVVDYIFKNYLYELNQEMIEIYIGRFTLNDTMKNKLLISNYTTINELESTEYSLLEYIHKEINFYVENVLLRIPENTQESETMIVELLNNEDLELKNKKAIIKKEETKISDISTIPNELWADVLQENKLSANWDNLLHYYQEINEFDEYLLAFLNINENYQELAEYKMNNKEVFGDELLQSISREILKSNQLSDEAYSYLIKSIIWKFPDLNMDLLSSIKVDEILANKIISLNQTIINSLKKNFPEKQIKLIESFRDEFLEKYEELTLDEDNYTHILESNKFSKDEKVSIIETIDLTLLESEELVHKIIAFYIDIEDNISKDLFDKLFEISDRDNALKLLTKQIPELNNDEISIYLNQFKGQYPELTEISRKPLKIPNTDINQNLVIALELKRYISSKDIFDKEIKINRRRK